ncbi:MAG TPA: hypothetical protein VNI61_02590 [Gemmatimonadales bacterium]|nr:hypothetical protein [Gemmatimonadales bacterium]
MTLTRLLLPALLGGALASGWSCRDPAPTGPAAPGLLPRADLIPPALPSGLLVCAPLPADSVTQTVGPEGGTIRVGPHALSVPAGALAAPVSITAVAPSDSARQVRFQPEGLVFAQPATLALSYADCELLGLTVAKRIAWTTDLLQILEYLDSVDDPSAQVVTGRLEHFSTYAVAW